MEDVGYLVRQPSTIILPDTNFFYPPSAFLTDNFPFCSRDGSWLDYLLLLQRMGDSPCLEKVASEVTSYTNIVKLLQHENVYTTVGGLRELQNAIRFFSRRYMTPLNGSSPENRRTVRDAIGETLETYRQLRRFLFDRVLEGPYLDSLRLCCEKNYSKVQEAVNNVGFPYNDKPSNRDMELIEMAVYIASISSREVVALSNDHHIYQGVPRACQYLGEDELPSRLSVIGINTRNGRLEEKGRLTF